MYYIIIKYLNYFCFGTNYSTAHKIHRLTDPISSIFEKNNTTTQY